MEPALYPRKQLSTRALVIALAVSAAVPVVFIAAAVVFMLTFNVNILEWME